MALTRPRLEHGCASCPLNGTPARWVAGDGPVKAPLVIVGEAPGENETIVGRPFIGRSGQLLNATLKMAGIERNTVYATNSVMCPIKPRPADLSACRGRLFKEILRHDPVMVLTVGKFAFQTVCESRVALTKVEGTLWWSDTLGLWILPTWHPAAALRTDTYYPAIVQSVMRAGKYIRGEEPLPQPHQEIHFPWTFFRTPEDVLVYCRYYKRKLESDPDLVIEFGADTESRSPGKRPHPEGDLWLMLQTYDGERGAAIDMTQQSKLSRKALSWLMRHPRTRWYWHNGCTYDTRVLRFNDVEVPADDRIEDTFVYGLGLSELGSRAGLEPLARTWLNAPAYKRELLDRAKYKHAKGPQTEEQWHWLARYGVTDAYLGYHLQRVLPTMVDAEGTLGMCNRILKPLALTCGRIASRGMPVDRNQIRKLEGVWGARLTELEDSLDDLAYNAGFPADERIARLVEKNDGRFNPRSHLQLAHLMFDVLGYSPTQGLTNRKFRASKWQGGDRARSCDADFLLGHDHTEAAPLMRYLRTYDKLLRTYVRGLAREIDPDGLIHPDFGIGSTVTGRLVVKPLLQVMPQHGAHRELVEFDFAAEVRRIFPARPGMVILAADFKQLEFRVAWALSGDVNLGKALMSGDMHAITARYMFQREEVDDHDRHAAKRVGFGVAFNRSAFTLSRGPLFDVLGGDSVSDEARQRMAQDYIDKFWGLYDTYYATQQYWMDTATKEGELTTPFGRKRRWMLITHENRHEIRNQASNYPIQSTASDMMSLSLINVEPRLTAEGLGWPLYTVHDQLITEIYEDKIDRAMEVLNEVMTTPYFDTKGAVFDITFEVGRTLGDVEKVTPPWQRTSK